MLRHENINYLYINLHSFYDRPASSFTQKNDLKIGLIIGTLNTYYTKGYWTIESYTIISQTISSPRRHKLKAEFIKHYYISNWFFLPAFFWLNHLNIETALCI